MKTADITLVFQGGCKPYVTAAGDAHQRVAAVLVTHNRPQLLLQALAALRAQTRPLDAIYIVDNASVPGSDASGFGLGSLDGVTVLRSEINLGGAGGFALGMMRAFAAGHDWIWLLDDDALARPDALARLLDAGADTGEAAADGKRVGALCGTVREFGDIALRHRRRYHLPTGIERALPRGAYQGQPCRVDTASFVGFLVSAAAIAVVGMPERAFFFGYEDTEYSLRLRRAGLALWLVPDSVVEHLCARSARLRAGPFGPKHYFTIRNRIAVARAYATLPVLPTAIALLFGVALWLASGGRLRRGAVRMLLHAIRDGCTRRLGPFPETLARLQGHPATTQVSTGTGPGRA
jgi:GT2 family glycosyltransferase